MTPEVRDKWVAALRSGKYSQTRHTLKDSDGFCCLGVLCSVMAEDFPKDFEVEEDDHEMGIIVKATEDSLGYTEDAELPQELREFFGMSIDDYGHFINANDIEKKDFNSIADLIEATYGENKDA